MADKKKELEKGLKRVFPRGFQVAIEMLQRLDPRSRDKILSDIKSKDERTFAILKNNMIVFNDLVYLTPKMVMELMREIKLDDLGLALRGGSREVGDHFLNNLSSNMKNDLLEILRGKPRPMNEVEVAQKKIMDVVFRKIERGEIIIDREGAKNLV